MLFLVQPLIAKLVLPWFGGTSSVWSATLVFFQGCVFVGYLYAHLLSTRLRPRTQFIVHALLLGASCVLLPIVPDRDRIATATSDPTLQILLLLTIEAGLPAILLASTSPLLQSWYARRTGGSPPYWLYSLSNAGSLLALLGFPLLLEPYFDVSALASAWSIVFALFAMASIGVAWMSRGETTLAARADQPVSRANVVQETLWLLFSACGSGLLVSVSAHLTTNVAPIPLLWVMPLALYLMTFILNFGSRRWYDRARFFPLFAAAIAGLAHLYTSGDTNLHVRYAIPLYLVALFVVCMACHGELVHARPASRHVTRFYLSIALGGVLGGIFVAVVAPLVFDTHWELPIILIATAGLAVFVQWRRHGSALRRWIVRGAMVAGVLALAVFLVRTEAGLRVGYRLVERNFYGVVRVGDVEVSGGPQRRVLYHGTISHGHQFLDPVYRDLPSAYYSLDSGVGRALLAMRAQGPMRVGIIGLGAGILAGYAREHDAYTMYEINPAIVRIASEQFDFVERARQRGARVDVVLGDARLSLEREQPRQFDVMAVDAFSSDAIPMHLLTQEAMELYFRHLKPEGLLAVHVSNRYVDLVPVCARAAQRMQRPAIVVDEPSPSQWILMTSNTALLKKELFENATVHAASAPANFKGWTDEYGNVWSVLKFGQ